MAIANIDTLYSALQLAGQGEASECIAQKQQVGAEAGRVGWLVGVSARWVGRSVGEWAEGWRGNWRRLPTCACEAAAPCMRGCNPMHARLQPCASAHLQAISDFHLQLTPTLASLGEAGTMLRARIAMLLFDSGLVSIVK